MPMASDICHKIRQYVSAPHECNQCYQSTKFFQGVLKSKILTFWSRVGGSTKFVWHQYFISTPYRGLRVTSAPSVCVFQRGVDTTRLRSNMFILAKILSKICLKCQKHFRVKQNLGKNLFV